MSEQTNLVAAPSAAGSERVRLARVARDAALQVPGVVDTDSGPMGRFITVGGGQRLGGVTCIAAQDGGFDVSLRLRCAMVPLPELLARVQLAVRQLASQAGLRVATLDVLVADVVELEHA